MRFSLTLEKGCRISATFFKSQLSFIACKRGYITGETVVTNYGDSKTVNKAYAYDAMGRLTQSSLDGKTESYTYDAVGNRLSHTTDDGAFTYTYGSFNRLSTIKRNGETYAAYTYDTLGNQIKEVLYKSTGSTLQTDEKEFVYNVVNQLEQVTVKRNSVLQVTSTSTYNASGQRLTRTDSGDAVEQPRTTQYQYTGSALLYTIDAEYGCLLTENILDPNGAIIAGKRFELPYAEQPLDPYAGKYFFYNYDVRGSVTNIVEADGSLVKGYDYDPFGKTTDEGQQNFLNETTFTGSVQDKATGLQYMNARYYDPNTGRFLSQDSYKGTATEPWTQHLYAYCGNNPVNMVDPTGFRPIVSGDLRGGTAVVKTSTGSYVVSRKEEARFIESNGSTTAKKRQIQYEENYLRTLQKKAEAGAKQQHATLKAIEQKVVSVQTLGLFPASQALVSDILLPAIDSYQEISSDWKGTASVVPTVSLSTGTGIVSAGVGIAQDVHGNIAIIYVPSGGWSTGTPGVSVMGAISATNAPTVDQLSGESLQTGGAAGLGFLGLGAEHITMIKRNGEAAYSGWTALVGPAAKAEIHGTTSNTYILARWNGLEGIETVLEWYSSILK